MPLRVHGRTEMVIMAALFAFSMSIAPALAMGDQEPPPAPPPGKSESDGNSTAKKGQESQEEHQRYVDGYKAARALVLDGKYEQGLQAFLALGHDDDAEVATYVGYAYRKLGKYDLSKAWYDRALAADPNHVRTLEYYGEWHVEQGNKLKAQEFLERIHVLCGNASCQEYIDLKTAIDGGRGRY
jgi:tetratricopeptide (TPR) repeat protein